LALTIVFTFGLRSTSTTSVEARHGSRYTPHDSHTPEHEPVPEVREADGADSWEVLLARRLEAWVGMRQLPGTVAREGRRDRTLAREKQ
jgi:hypothetical protein